MRATQSTLSRAQNVEHKRRTAFVRVLAVLAVADLWCSGLCWFFFPGTQTSVLVLVLSALFCSVAYTLCLRGQLNWAGVCSSFGHSVMIFAVSAMVGGARLTLLTLLPHIVVSVLPCKRRWTVYLGGAQMVAVSAYCTWVPSNGLIGEAQPVYFLPLMLTLICALTCMMIAASHFNDAILREALGTSRKLEKARNKERALREEAEQANATKGLFLATMSHELRTPLNAIIGYSEMLRDDYEHGEAMDEQVFKDLDRIHHAGEHLLGLISSLLDLSKIEAGQMSVYPETIHLQRLITQVLDEVAAIARGGDTTLVQDVPDEPLEIISDHIMLTQILSNLVSNALKFSRGGTVTVGLYERDEGVTLKVQDTGIGMTPAELERIFEAFVQADETTTRAYGGTGLGLALVQNFGDLIGARVRVESEPGVGSTFYVELPREPSKPAHSA